MYYFTHIPIHTRSISTFSFFIIIFLYADFIMCINIYIIQQILICCCCFLSFIRFFLWTIFLILHILSFSYLLTLISFSPPAKCIFCIVCPYISTIVIQYPIPHMIYHYSAHIICIFITLVGTYCYYQLIR